MLFDIIYKPSHKLSHESHKLLYALSRNLYELTHGLPPELPFIVRVNPQVKSTVHWGYRKNLVMEIEFLLAYGEKV